MIDLLVKMIPEIRDSILKDQDWDSLIINRRKPWTYRVFRQFGEHRVCLHVFESCDSEESFPHPHPWPGAFLILNGSYVQRVGYSATRESEPVFFYKEILNSYSAYEILDPKIWHSVQPLSRCYTIMVNGKPWEETETHKNVRTTKGKDLEKMQSEDLDNHKNLFLSLLDKYMFDHPEKYLMSKDSSGFLDTKFGMFGVNRKWENIDE